LRNIFDENAKTRQHFFGLLYPKNTESALATALPFIQSKNAYTFNSLESKLFSYNLIKMVQKFNK
jgi:hypothetical protein